MTRRGWVLFVALGVLWGLPYLLIKVSVREISPPLLVFIRTGGAAVVLVPVAAASGALRPVLRRWRPLVLYTLCELAIPWVLLSNAERRLPSSLAGLLVAAVPLVAAVLAFATGSDRVDLRRLAGLALGVGGVGALVGFDVAGSQLAAVASMAAVVVGYAVGPWIVAHRLDGVPPLGAIAWSFVICAVLYSPSLAFALPSRPLSASVIESAAALTVLCTVAAFLVAFALIKEVGAMRSTLITYVNPAVAVVLGVAVLGEPFGVATGVGFVLVLAGCFLATRPLGRPTPGPPHPPGLDAGNARGGVGAGPP
jgi:drug/metabolite transporter (DMT)-like permease